MNAELRNSIEKISYFHVSNDDTGLFVYPLYLIETANLDCHIMSRKYGLYATDFNYIKLLDMMSDSDDSYDTAVPINDDGTYPHGGEAVTIYEHSFIPCGITPYTDIKRAFELKLNDAIAECIASS